MSSERDLKALSEKLKDSFRGILIEDSGDIACIESRSPTEAILRIIPKNSAAAPVEITLDKEFGAYLKVGKASIFEVPFQGKRYTEGDFISEITNLISGIVTGGFEEDVIISRGNIVGASGAIKAGGRLPKAVSDAWMKVGMALFWKKEREHHAYCPYSS